MTISRSSLTRRSALRLGALGLGAMGLGGLVLAPVAMAQTSVQWPLRLAYARISPSGFVTIRGDEQSAWAAMQTRLGGLIGAIQPIQPSDMMGVSLPKIEGAASCAMVARQMASAAGFNHVILYFINSCHGKVNLINNWYYFKSYFFCIVKF